jgi:membrane protein insertase Oxa1/YidC/SpoIIIJ
MMIQPKEWAAVFAALTPDQMTALAGFGIDAATINSDTVFAALQSLPLYAEQTQLWSFMPAVNLVITQLLIYSNNNGWFILPILSAVTQYLMTLSQPQQPAANGQNSTGQFMKYFFPLFSLWICSSYNALFSLYWVISNVFAWIQSIVLNKVFENMEKKEKSNKEENLK